MRERSPFLFLPSLVLVVGLALLHVACAPASSSEPAVVRVIDGDTIDVAIAGDRFRLRYIGVDTPETGNSRVGIECFGREATRRNRELVEGRRVRLEKDVSETDAFGRLLRYVWLPDGRMVNEVLVAEGYARVATYPPDVKYTQRFLAAEREARKTRRGLWGKCP